MFKNCGGYFPLPALLLAFAFSLIACDGGGTSGDTEPELGEPIAEFTVDSETPIVNTEVTFDASGSSSPNAGIDTYRWDFTGDGTTDVTTGDPDTTYIYEEAGTFDVTLEVEDQAGESGSTSRQITTQKAPQLADTPWPTSGHDLRRTGLSTFNGPEDGTEKWTLELGQNSRGGPVIGPDGIIYAGIERAVVAINPDGSEKWRFETETEFEVFQTPTIDSDETIYVGSEIGTGGGKLYALNPDGTKKWTFKIEPEGGVRGAAAIGQDGSIYFGSDNNRLYAVSPDGSEKWRFRAGDSFEGSPSIGTDGTVYASSRGGFVYALEPDGTRKWSFQTRGIPRTPAVGPDGAIYIGVSLENRFYAINPDGTEKWTFPTESATQPPAVGSDGTVFVTSWEDDTADFFLHARNPDGSEKWTFEAGAILAKPTIGASGTIYTMARDLSEDSHFVFAISPNGDVQWKSFEMATWTSGSLAMGSDGTMFVTPRTGVLHAIE